MDGCLKIDTVGQKTFFLSGGAAEFVAVRQASVGADDFVARDLVRIVVLLQDPTHVTRVRDPKLFRDRAVGRHLPLGEGLKIFKDARNITVQAGHIS